MTRSNSQHQMGRLLGARTARSVTVTVSAHARCRARGQTHLLTRSFDLSSRFVMQSPFASPSLSPALSSSPSLLRRRLSGSPLLLSNLSIDNAPSLPMLPMIDLATHDLDDDDVADATLALAVHRSSRRPSLHAGSVPLLAAAILPANVYVQQRLGSILSRGMILKADQFPSQYRHGGGARSCAI